MRTIIAVVSASVRVPEMVNLQLFADDTKVAAPVVSVPRPRSEIEWSRLETDIRNECLTTFGVGAPHGWRKVYNSPSNTVTIFEYDFDSPRRFEA